MAFFRWLFGLPLAAVITVGLFFFMAGLIKQGPFDPPPIKPYEDIKIIADTPPPVGPEHPKPRKIEEDYPDVEYEPPRPTSRPGPVQGDPLPGPASSGGPQEQKGVIYNPSITVAPPYPETCRTKGIEGVVVVQFDVTPEGNVVNVQVVSAPDNCFRRIVSSIAKWKYPPAYQDGRPVMRYGVIEQFNFVLTE